MSDRERQVKHVVLTAIDLCPVCGHGYEPDSVDLIGQRDDLWVLRVLCQHCQRQGFIAALVNCQVPETVLSPDPTGLLAAPPAIDSHDQRHDGAWSPVTPRDVLTMHEFLLDFEGDLRAYLTRFDG